MRMKTAVFSYRESSFGVADGQIRVMVLVADFCGASSQLCGAAIFAMVVGHRTIAHHSRDVGK